MNINRKFLKAVSYSVFTQVRTFIKNFKSPGGIQYFNFKYYPRNPQTFKDPPYEPSKLFLVTRIKHVWGSNPVERDALQKLNLDGHKKTSGHIAIVKNIPEVNKLLWKIKHMVKIVPIRTPNGLPKDPSEIGSSYLLSNGELILKPKLAPERLEALGEAQKSYFDSVAMKKHLLLKWNNPWQGSIPQK